MTNKGLASLILAGLLIQAASRLLDTPQNEGSEGSIHVSKCNRQGEEPGFCTKPGLDGFDCLTANACFTCEDDADCKDEWPCVAFPFSKEAASEKDASLRKGAASNVYCEPFFKYCYKMTADGDSCSISEFCTCEDASDCDAEGKCMP